MGRKEKMLSFTWMIVSGDRRQQRGPWGRDMGTRGWDGGTGHRMEVPSMVGETQSLCTGSPAELLWDDVSLCVF